MLTASLWKPRVVACQLAIVAALLSGCDAPPSAAPGTAGSTASPSSSVGVERPAIPESLKALLAEMDELAKQQTQPKTRFFYIQKFNGRSPYQVDQKGNLISVDLNNCPVNDEFLEKLKDQPAIVSMNLMGTKITDQGLEYLDGLQAITQLFVDYTDVTAEGVARFRDSHPTCKVTDAKSPD